MTEPFIPADRVPLPLNSTVGHIMIVKNINLQKVRKFLRYERVNEVVKDDWRRYDIMPSNEEWPKAYLVTLFDTNSEKHDVLQAGFGEYHDHFELYRNPDRNVAAALSFLAEVVSGRVCVIAGYDKSNNYIGGSLCSVANLQHCTVNERIIKNAESAIRYIFNREPESLDI